MTSRAPETLEHGSVGVRYARIGPPSPGRTARDLALLSEAERERYGRRRPEKRPSFLAAHALVRRTLSRYAERAPAEWRFAPDALGKPEIIDPQPGEKLSFSLSHTRGLVACAVTRAFPVGIDAESAEGRRPYAALAGRVLAAGERRDLDALPGADQADRFLDYWTLKEAHLKARGTGIRSRLAALEFRLEGEAGAECLAEPGFAPVEGAWHYLRLCPSPVHRLAVACACKAAPRWKVAEEGP